MNIGLLIIATGKYKMFLADLIKSADKFFFTKDSSDIVHYYLFVDETIEILSSSRSVTQIIIDHNPWPFSTLCRYHHFVNHKHQFDNLDYIYYIDSDMYFVDHVDSEILSDIVCVEHPWFPDRDPINNDITIEHNTQSTSHIPKHIKFQYMQNAFFGGNKNCILNMFEFLANQIDIDYQRGIIARWHDESHANKFYIAYATKILDRSYCYDYRSPLCSSLTPKIVSIIKDDTEMRSV